MTIGKSYICNRLVWEIRDGDRVIGNPVLQILLLSTCSCIKLISRFPDTGKIGKREIRIGSGTAVGSRTSLTERVEVGISHGGEARVIGIRKVTIDE